MNRILQGNSLEVLKTLPAAEFYTCVTSPPYWGLRDYEAGPEEIGTGKEPEEYIRKLCDIFDQVKIVLKDTGTLWINIDDTYGGSNSRSSKGGRAGLSETVEREGVFNRGTSRALTAIPEMLVLELIKRGWC